MQLEEGRFRGEEDDAFDTNSFACYRDDIANRNI